MNSPKISIGQIGKKRTQISIKAIQPRKKWLNTRLRPIFDAEFESVVRFYLRILCFGLGDGFNKAAPPNNIEGRTSTKSET